MSQGGFSSLDHTGAGDQGQGSSRTDLEAAYFYSLGCHAYGSVNQCKMHNANFKFFIFNFALCILPSLSPRHLDSGDFSKCQPVLQGRFDEALKKGMAVQGTGLELGVKLAAHEPPLVFKFY